MKRIIIAITGATGVIYGIRTLEILREKHIETHLILSESAKQNILIETDYKIADVEQLASVVHDVRDMTASLASGSFKTDGMIVVPCTVKTLSAIANSFNDNLIVRAADCVLKERRRLVVVVRETPLHRGHLELMTQITQLGGIVLPPVPAFYHNPTTIKDLIDHTVGKIMDLMAIDNALFRRWEGILPKGISLIGK